MSGGLEMYVQVRLEQAEHPHLSIGVLRDIE